MASVAEIFEAMPSKFKGEAAAGMDAVYQYVIDGDDGGAWHTLIKDGTLTVVEGTHESPSVTLSMKSSDYIDLAEGRLNGQAAFMTGKLKIQGDMGLALKLNSLFGE
jgi:putative sterol carrier protein